MTNWKFLNQQPQVAGSISPPAEPVAPIGDSDGPMKTVVTGERDAIKDLSRYGFRAAGQSNASPEVLKTLLGWIYHNKVTIDDAHATEEQERIAAINEQLSTLQGDLRALSHNRDQTKEAIAKEYEQIAEKRREVSSVQAGDGTLVEAHGPGDRASFFIAASILALVTVYLFLFYVSAIYNAFLFDPTTSAAEGLRTGRELSVTIFNGAAFQKAWSSGLMTFLFLCTAPSIVVGLGFLIHHFSKEKKQKRIPVVMAITFFFDLLLAYQIVYQIDRIKVLTGESTAPWSMRVLVSSPEFWIILLAGFVVYVMWGMILQVVLEGIEKFHPARALMRTLREAIRSREGSIEHLNNELRNIGRREAELQGQVTALELRRSPKETKNRQFFRHIEELMHGWLQYIGQAYPEECKQKEAEAQRIKDETVKLLTT
jgi:hypothetical protein